MRLCDARGTCLCVKNDFQPHRMPFSFSFFFFFICTVCLPCCAVCSGPWKAELQASLPKLPAAPCALRYASVSSPVARYRAALQRPPNSNMKRLRSIIGLNVLWKYCVSLFVSFLCLSPTLSPPSSPVLHLIHPICFGTVRHVAKYTSPTAHLPKYHCFIVLFLRTREKKDVFTFSF